MEQMTADQIIKQLDLKPHPEGGFYRETYRSSHAFDPSVMGGAVAGPRAFSTAIYYLLVPGVVSKFHRLASDEMFHFYLGDPVTWTLLDQDGRIEKAVLGAQLERGHRLQLLIPAGTWFGGVLDEGGLLALMGTTVAPGFDFKDFELADRDVLIRQYPEAEREILSLT